MKNLKRFLKKRGILFAIVIVLAAGICLVSRTDVMKNKTATEKENTKQKTIKKTLLEKGYNLPVDEEEKTQAESDLTDIMVMAADIYESVEKRIDDDMELTDETLDQIQNRLKQSKNSITTAKLYSNMDNYEQMEHFLRTVADGKQGEAVLFEVYQDGGMKRSKFTFDGTDMYVFEARKEWKKRQKPGLTFAALTRIKEWTYTDSGWFCYELCVPEPPEVTEVVDGSCMIRIKPMKEEYRELSQKYVLPLGYQGNNVLSCNWDTGNLEVLDYNGLYEYLYKMKYEEKFAPENSPNQIPKEEFEQLIMQYIPVTAQQIQQYAVYDEETESYAWGKQGCMNYAPTFFGTSIPEVIGIKEQEDGTVILTVEAICEIVLSNEAVITHELTIRFLEDGSIQYLGNRILKDGMEHMPAYQYRVSRISK